MKVTKAINNVIEKAATLTGSLLSHQRPKGTFTDPKTTNYHLALIFDYLCHNQITLPIVIEKASGAYVWDVTGKKYIDYVSSFSCANQGHAHPKICEALIKQAKELPMTTIVAPHNQLGPAAKHLTERLGYKKILFMNSGAEAVDTAVLTARKWGYIEKKVPMGQATILFPHNCYWGMTLSARAGTDLNMVRQEADPLGSDALHFDFVGYDDPEALEAKFKANPNICAFVFEPIQGEAGNVYPSPGYYTKVRDLCTKYNVLMVCDEIQAGLGRTGKLFTVDWEGVKPDMITLGKSLGGNYLPVSAVLGNDEVMNVWLPGTHLSTYAANSLACAVAVASIDVLFEEKLVERAEYLGKIVEQEFSTYNYSFITKKNCGKGLFASLEFSDHIGCVTVGKWMLDKGVLTMPGAQFIRVMPPLCISEEDLRASLKILRECLDEYDKKGKLGLFV